jgi:hypothetical protein
MALVTFLAGEPIDRFTPVTVTSGGFVYKSCALDPTTAYMTGLSLTSGNVNSQIKVQTDNIVPNFPGSPGESYYVGGVSGTIASGYSQWETSVDQVTAGAFLTSFGIGLTSNDLSLEIDSPIFVSGSGFI